MAHKYQTKKGLEGRAQILTSFFPLYMVTITFTVDKNQCGQFLSRTESRFKSMD